MNIVLQGTQGACQFTIFETGAIEVDGVKIPLTAKEREFVQVLAQTPGLVRTTAMLEKALYASAAYTPEIKIFDVFACKIRTKLYDIHADAGELIATAWGRGYVLGASRARDPSAPAIFETDFDRWTPGRKAQVVDLVSSHDISLQQVLDYYPDLSAGEFEEWLALYRKHGVAGLRTTKTQEYLTR